MYRGLRACPVISRYVRVSARMTRYARNAGFTLAEKTSVLRALGWASNALGERAGTQGTNGLSPQSFANLRSVAQAEEWTDTEVLKLISESLRTPAGVGYAYRNRVVSGSDWKQLHRRIHGSGR